jgi:hypothetical protein
MIGPYPHWLPASRGLTTPYKSSPRLPRTSEIEEDAFLQAAKQGIVTHEVAAAMAHRRFRDERARAAAALAAYVGNPCPATGRWLLAATHDLEVAAALRGRRAVSGRRGQLAHLVTH